MGFYCMLRLYLVVHFFPLSCPVYVLVTLRIERCKIQTEKIWNFYSLNVVTLSISPYRDWPRPVLFEILILHTLTGIFIAVKIISHRCCCSVLCTLTVMYVKPFTLQNNPSCLTAFKKQKTLASGWCFDNFSNSCSQSPHFFIGR